jgi:gamma-glutamyltranspeptidase/glutathione hydrolase
MGGSGTPHYWGAGGRGLVAVSHPLAAEAGAEMLRAGGNAIDAAAAVQFALNVAEPLASGIGGGAFSLIHLADGEMLALDSRERAPAGATADQFLGTDGWPIPCEEQCASGKAVGVPGTLMGLDLALGRWGRLPLARVLRPAIELAEGGLPVSAFMARRLEPQVAKLARDPASAAIFLPGGRPLQTGDRLVQPDLARTLRLLAEQGPDVFYRGEIAEAIVVAVRAGGGSMTLDDLAAYRVELREPLYGKYRGHDIATMPPPGAGVTLLEMLGLLEAFDPPALGRMTAARAHLELQAMRLALADRAAYLGDPAYTAVPVPGLLDADYLAARRALIERERLGPKPGPGGPAPLDSGAGRSQRRVGRTEVGQTTHFGALDRWGNLVCCTSTIEDFFGSGITVPGYGFLLNNELTDFDLQPGSANEIRPFGRPASSMAPTLLLRRGRPWLALGSPGGPTIVTAILQTLLGLLDDGLSLEAAVAAPRYFADRYPRVTWERVLPAETLAALSDLGHRPSNRPTTIGSVQAIMMDPENGRWFGVADPRREGAVIEVV